MSSIIKAGIKTGIKAGMQLGRYRIGEVLGEGGMGKVYEAEDMRLGRPVAVKVLPPSLNDDLMTRARFEREAKTIAALNHPNIVTVHSVEEVDGCAFIVMELVRGQSLAQLIPPKGVTAELFFRYAIPLVDAVGAAHQQGITHRDLKPHNVMISDDGRVKVLDFGLAKGWVGTDAADSTDSTDSIDGTEVTHPTMTNEGAIVGTVAYMSPEQAQGRPVDSRSDLFSLGVLLFEMATGRRPFGGDSNTSTLASILRDPAPSLRSLNPAVSPTVERIILRCLEKEPVRRYQSAIDLRWDLEETRDRRDEGVPSTWKSWPIAPPTKGSKRAAALVIGGLCIASAAWTVGHYWVGGKSATPGGTVAPGGSGGISGAVAPSGPSGSLGTSTVPSSSLKRPRIDHLQRLTSDDGPELSPSLSPDGTWFVYSRRVAGKMDIYRRRVGGENPMNLTAGHTVDAEDPSISPDGEHIAFASFRPTAETLAMGAAPHEQLLVMGANGESEKRITDFGRHPVWSPDGTQIAFSTEKVQFDTALFRGTSEVWIVTPASGELHRVASAVAAQPSFSPHGRRLAMFRVDGRGVRDLWDMRTDGTDAVRLTDDPAVDWNPVWSPDGQWLYFASDRGGAANLWRMPIDEESGRATGEPEPVTLSAGTRDHSISFSRNGSHMAFVADATRYLIKRVPFDAARGVVTGPPEQVAAGASPSVHGGFIAYETLDNDDIAVAHVNGTGRRRLTEDHFKDLSPQWSPDGSRIAFRSDRDGRFQCWAIHPDGSGLERLSQFEHGSEGRRCIFSPDGSRMASRVDGGGVAIFDPRKPWRDQTPTMLPAPGKGRAFTPYAWSPDGRSILGFEVAETEAYKTLILDVATGTYHPMGFVAALAVWLADSRRVLWQLHGQIVMSDIHVGKSHTVLPDAYQGIGNFTLSHDQRWLYYELIALDADVWQATLK